MALRLKRMSKIPKLSRFQWFNGLCTNCRRKFTTVSTLISEGDIVLLRRKDKAKSSPILTKPLSPGSKIQSHKGTLDHSDVVGKQVRDVVTFSRGGSYRIHWPTLADYVELTPRIVTPVYPADANLIVSLLDIHASPPTEPSSTCPQNSTFEILEAGTGHGALTLHLARAIHAANPELQLPLLKPDNEDNDRRSDLKEHPEKVKTIAAQFEAADDPAKFYNTNAESDQLSDHERWKVNRGAIIHTVDISAAHSDHARRIVRGFRRGMYAGSVDFYTGNVSEWIEEQIRNRVSAEPFLAHVILDLPSTHLHLSHVASALRVDGLLAVFNPNITQLTKCVEIIREKRLPFVLDRIVELGGSTGGREWDVRAVKPRALLKAEKEQKLAASEQSSRVTKIEKRESAVLAEDGAIQSPTMDGIEKSRAEEHAESSVEQESGWEMVCRPKVGDRVVGGGFLGLWRRMKNTADCEN